jgi:hypothetical protein
MQVFIVSLASDLMAEVRMVTIAYAYRVLGSNTGIFSLGLLKTHQECQGSLRLWQLRHPSCQPAGLYREQHAVGSVTAACVGTDSEHRAARR